MSRSPGRAWPIHPLLFAAYAVLSLFAQNVAEVGLRDVVPPLGRSVIGAALVLAIAGLVFRDLRRGALVASAAIAAFFGYGHVAGIVGADVGRDAQLAAWALLLAVAAVLAWRLDARRVATVTGALDAVGLVLVAVTLFQVAPAEAQALAREAQPPSDRPAPVAGDRDIWFLVFDRYGSERSLEAYAGIDNDLPEWLESRGFQVARNAHANYGRTSLSLASTFELDYLDELVARMGAESTDLAPLNEMLQDHVVGRTLRERGYRIIQLGSWYTPTASSRIADEVPQAGTETDFDVLLRDTTMLPLADGLVTKPEIGHDDSQHRDNALFQLRMLERLRGEPGPKFVFAHVLLPHPPYVFLEDGSYPDEAVRAAGPAEELFARQLAYTNGRIREVVDELLDAPPDRRPIVIVAADEGPYPRRYEADTKGFDWADATDGEVVTKYGILQAIYLPGPAGPGEPVVYDTMSPVNTFRIVFDRAFGADLPLLPDRSYTSRDYEHPYALTDVTERLGIDPGG